MNRRMIRPERLQFLSVLACVALLFIAAGGCGASGELVVDWQTIHKLPAGSVVDESIEVMPYDLGGGIRFAAGGIEIPIEDHITANEGTVEITFRSIEDWRSHRQRRTLFYLGDEETGYISIYVSRGTIWAESNATRDEGRMVYRGGRYWDTNEAHQLQLSWRGEEGVNVFYMRVDGELVGAFESPVIEDWPGVCYLGAEGESDPYEGVVEKMILLPTMLPQPELEAGQRLVVVDTGKVVGRNYDFWSVGNFVEPHLIVDEKERVRVLQTYPLVTEMNFVYMMGGRWEGENEWYLGLDENGKIRTDFTGMIEQLRTAMELGYKPRIVLDDVPVLMSDPPQMNHYGNTAPPADEKIWREYVMAAVQAMIDAFGREEVASWSFRVGTEPDLKPAHWAGTKEEYFAHYDYTVDAMDRVLPEAKIGPGNILNPGHLNQDVWARNRWGLDIIDHCATGVNAATGKVGTRIDHFSCSWYGRVNGSIDNFDLAMTQMRERLDKYPQFKDVRLEVGEHALLHDELGRRLWAGDTTEYGASFFAALSDRVYAHDVGKVFEWDHATMKVFHPKGHVVRMLQWMENGERLKVEVEGKSAARCGAVAVNKDGKVYVMLYNHRPWRVPRVEETVKLRIVDQRMKQGGRWKVVEHWVDAEHTVWAYEFAEDCQKAGVEFTNFSGRFEGSPWKLYGDEGAEVFARNIEKYRKMSELPRVEREVEVGDGVLEMEYDMPGHSVRFLEISAE